MGLYGSKPNAPQAETYLGSHCDGWDWGAGLKGLFCLCLCCVCEGVCEGEARERGGGAFIRTERGGRRTTEKTKSLSRRRLFLSLFPVAPRRPLLEREQARADAQQKDLRKAFEWSGRCGDRGNRHGGALGKKARRRPRRPSDGGGASVLADTSPFLSARLFANARRAAKFTRTSPQKPPRPRESAADSLHLCLQNDPACLVRG